jgi:hypothetical protein
MAGASRVIVVDVFFELSSVQKGMQNKNWMPQAGIMQYELVIYSL